LFRFVVVGETNTYSQKIPYMEDVRKYNFPSLEILYNKAGRQLEEHKNLPTKAMQDAMDDFVDMMDLEDAGRDEEGCVDVSLCVVVYYSA
jgi:hypothetical protein